MSASEKSAVQEPDEYGEFKTVSGLKEIPTYWFDQDQLLYRDRHYWTGRRVQDVFFSLLALLILWPVMLLIALAIWIDSPVLVRFLCRIGWGEMKRYSSFTKFRTMVPHAEDKLNEFISQNEMDGPVFKIKDDPRITRVGKFLRKTGLDELPQLINILRGEMSIVGPRPPLPREVAQYTPYQKQRLYVTPGLTCYWQVQPNRNEMSFDEWIELDLKYINDRNFWLDWKLIFQTIWTILGMYGV